MNFCDATLEGLCLFVLHLNKFSINTLLIQKNEKAMDSLYSLIGKRSGTKT